jgi:hypothetical protein
MKNIGDIRHLTEDELIEWINNIEESYILIFEDDYQSYLDHFKSYKSLNIIESGYKGIFEVNNKIDIVSIGQKKFVIGKDDNYT